MSFLSIASLTRKELVFAAAALLIAAILAGRFLIKPKNDLPGRGGAPLPMKSLGTAPILQLELARNEQDISAIVTTGEVKTNIADARAGNRLDTWLFIPLYAGSLLLMGIFLSRGEIRWPGASLWFSILAVGTIAISDWTENAGIERTLQHIEANQAPQSGDAAAIAVPSRIKWILLAVVLLVYAICALLQPGVGVKLFGLALLAVAGFLIRTLVAYFQEAGYG
jgi:hypothetical protein